ncbi:aminotransferase class I/II-fold pyridoxal phosphate-dependent enzyme [Acuticoccus mangrovi]|uniref:Aminotransferase n=1 Tax=Acuticoccus mangrovi TaxID=2796142 RepID=A0A934MII0_9HYPH|nr:aminotransferase class I/II-fold pyridoxal phosphate-dependent enzyme [Acuticoccus mangrovi]MBJ3777221.1 aminotransferase class I/II-fold pyridoxal phosphate-dependent enzyme [Acuticoccus mangrovi]
MFEAQSPFERLRGALSGIAPGLPPIDLSVGSPRHAPPDFVAEVIGRHAAAFGGYPSISGTPAFQEAVHGFLDRRYRLEGWLREVGALLPLSGSREGLFLSALTARDLLAKADPAILFANPFYQVYPAAAHAFGAEPVPIGPSHGSILPDWDTVPAAVLDRTIAYYFGSPSNPAGTWASLADWHALFDRALEHDFFIFADECYSEVYREAIGAPVGALEAAKERPEALSRLFVFNSLSKRSNLAGLRVGFVAGAAEPIAAMREFRNQAGPQVPTPLQEAAAAAYNDEAHVVANRRLYDAKYAAAERILSPIFGSLTTPAGFFLWLPVGGDDVAAAVMLWREVGVRVVPGRFLALGSAGGNPGEGHVRLALVADQAEAEEAFERIASVYRAALPRAAAAHA